MSTSADTILKELVGIRVARRAKFVPYDLDRRLKRKERELWDTAERLYEPRPEPPKARKPEKAAT